MTPNTALTGAGWYFSASHYDEVRKETHGHSYEVIAWWVASPDCDAVIKQLVLKAALKELDHKTLPSELARAEDIAVALGGLLAGCIGVDIARPAERLYAQWRL